MGLILFLLQVLFYFFLNLWFKKKSAEGCFTISFTRNKDSSLVGWSVKPSFQIGLHEKDLSLLKKIQSYFGVGSLNKCGSDIIQYRVRSLKDLKVIVNHFDKSPLITQKQGDYLLFKRRVNLINNKQDLTKEGLLQILAIKASMNNGISGMLKAAFPNVIPVNRDKFTIPTINPYWLAGFTEGEGCFLVSIQRSKTTKLKEAVQLMFKLGQHNRDEQPSFKDGRVLRLR